MPASKANAISIASRMGIGYNIERASTFSNLQFSDWHALGLRSVRRFLPYTPSGSNTGKNVFGFPSEWPKPPSNAEVMPWMDAGTAAIKAGLVYHLDLTDVVMDNSWGGNTDFSNTNLPYMEQHLTNAAKLVAAQGWDPSMYIIGAVNEYAGSKNANIAQYVKAFHDILRKYLPNTTLVRNSAYWGDRAVLMSTSDPFDVGDGLDIVQFHNYDAASGNGSTAAYWKNVASALTSWASTKGIKGQVIAGELGPGACQEQYSGTADSGYICDAKDGVEWAKYIQACAQGLLPYGIPFMPWTVTNQATGCVNGTNCSTNSFTHAWDATFNTAIAAGIKASVQSSPPPPAPLPPPPAPLPPFNAPLAIAALQQARTSIDAALGALGASAKGKK